MEWIKTWVKDSLEGVVRHHLTPAQRGTFYDLRLLAGKYDQAGKLADEKGKPLSRRYIAGLLNVYPGLLDRTIKRCIDLGLLREDATGILITSWSKTQPEYNRQKPYRERDKGVPTPSKYKKVN